MESNKNSSISRMNPFSSDLEVETWQEIYFKSTQDFFFENFLFSMKTSFFSRTPDRDGAVAEYNKAGKRVLVNEICQGLPD